MQLREENAQMQWNDGSQLHDGNIRYPYTNENEMKTKPKWGKGENHMGTKLLPKIGCKERLSDEGWRTPQNPPRTPSIMKIHEETVTKKHWNDTVE